MKICFDKAELGQSMPSIYNIDEAYKIFRHVEIHKKARQPEAWFIVRFTLQHMDVHKNKIFSLLPMLALFFFKGFRSKYWLMDEKPILAWVFTDGRH